MGGLPTGEAHTGILCHVGQCGGHLPTAEAQEAVTAPMTSVLWPFRLHTNTVRGIKCSATEQGTL